jgi:hypothetical protein
MVLRKDKVEIRRCSARMNKSDDEQLASYDCESALPCFLPHRPSDRSKQVEVHGLVSQPCCPALLRTVVFGPVDKKPGNRLPKCHTGGIVHWKVNARPDS